RAAGHILASHIAAAFLGDCEYLQSMAISNVLWYMRMGNYRMVISAIAELDLDLRDRAIDALVARIIAIYPHPIARMYGANLARPDIPYDADTLAVFAAINAALAPLNIPIVPALKITAYVNNTPHILLGHFIDNMPVFALRDISRILCGTQAQFALRSDSAAQFMIAHHAPYRPVVITMGTTPSPSNRPRLRISEGKPVYFIMGRSYVNPADFADALGFDMAWDGDNLIIDTREQAANENARRAARDFIAQFCGIFCEYAQSRRHTQATPYVRDFGVGYAVARFFSFYDFNGDGNPDIIVHFGGGLDSVLFRLIDDQYQEIAILPYNASSNVFTDPTGRIITRFQTFQEVGYFALEYAQGSWQTTQLSRETPIFGMHRVPFDIGPAENFSMEDFWRHYNRNRHGYTPDNNTTPDIPLNPIHRMIVEEQITRAALNHPPTKPQPPLPQNPHPILVNN
ncbi:MAG: hypothetical protein FWB71_05275, partial [Defluviitaleaceae bacterium]|nr:hypothetical protein [Defluviitaleaceae bacterium]